MTSSLTLAILLLGIAVASADPPADPPKLHAALSLRDEATRVATELVSVRSRTDPEVAMWQVGRFTQTGRGAKLEGGAAAATFVGTMLLALGATPLAALGVLATGATLDAAAGDIEVEHPVKAKPRVKHTLY